MSGLMEFQASWLGRKSFRLPLVVLGRVFTFQFYLSTKGEKNLKLNAGSKFDLILTCFPKFAHVSKLHP